MTLNFIDFQYVPYQTLVAAMENQKAGAIQMIPESKRHTAVFIGYRVYCHGEMSVHGYRPIETCDFKIPHSKEITREMHRTCLQHFFDHPKHEISIAAEFDFTVETF